MRVIETAAPQSNVWAYRALSFHGVASGLSVGSHSAELKYRVQQFTTYVPRHETDGSGEGYVRLTSVVLPDAGVATDKLWPSTRQDASGSSWMSIPAGPISTSFTLSGGEASL